ncbi:MAG TPA: hypothetical protein VLN91_00800 [Nitrospirota bacterium]|nr:hypothetical protein [Nitrospirota bacterium]
MVSLFSLLFQIAGLGIGIYRIWPDAAYLLAVSQAGTGPTFMNAIEAGERILLSCALVLLPFMATLKLVMGNKFWSALTVLVFSGLSVILAHVLHDSIIDGYVFFLSQKRHWISIARPAAIFAVVSINWLIAFDDMYRVVKVAGK